MKTGSNSSYDDFIKLRNSFDRTIIVRDHSKSGKICGMACSGIIKTNLKEKNSREIHIITVQYMYPFIFSNNTACRQGLHTYYLSIRGVAFFMLYSYKQLLEVHIAIEHTKSTSHFST